VPFALVNLHLQRMEERDTWSMGHGPVRRKSFSAIPVALHGHDGGLTLRPWHPHHLRLEFPMHSGQHLSCLAYTIPAKSAHIASKIAATTAEATEGAEAATVAAATTGKAAFKLVEYRFLSGGAWKIIRGNDSSSIRRAISRSSIKGLVLQTLIHGDKLEQLM